VLLSQQSLTQNGSNSLFEPHSNAFAKNPYSFYADLRQLDEPYFYEGADAYLLSRYVDVEGAARNPALVRSLEAFMDPETVKAEQRARNWHDMPNHERFVQFSLLERDDDTHFRLRVIVLRALSRRFVEQQRSMIETYVDRLLDQLLQQKEFDFIADLASHVPGHIIGHLLGVPDEDCPALRIWSENIVQFFDVGRTEEHKLLAENATTEFYLYLSGLIADRRKNPKEDLISSLVAAQDAGEMNEAELISTCMLILAAGHGSTIDVLGSGMHALISHRDQMHLLRQEPGHIHMAVQEMFRFESPLPFFHRYASEELVFNGKTYPRGTKFGLLYGSANRDPDQFPDADRFDVTRDPNRHVAFGRGAHLCLGNHLSRLDMEVIFLGILKKTRHIELSGPEPTYKKSLSARGLESLRVALTPK
jgi:cytochrome P450